MSTSDIAGLSQSQQEALQTFISVTDQDSAQSISLLQRCEWNVQIAISRFFDGEPATDPLAEGRASLPSASTRQTSNLQYGSLLATNRPSIATTASENRVERIDTSATSTTFHQPSLLLSALLTPFSIAYRILTTVFSPFSFLVPGFISRFLARLVSQRTKPRRRALAPADNARRFIREFGEEYGNHKLPFTESGFNLTLDEAQKELRFLLVVLLSPSHDDNATWVRETLLDSTFRDFLHRHKDDIILWGGNVQDPEAYQVSTSLQCTKFPFAALICQSNESGASGMTVIMRATGLVTPPELIGRLEAAITSQQAQLNSSRAQRAEQDASRNLRQEQDSAYERSLAQDRERARRKKEEQEAQAKAEKLARAAAEAEEMRMLKLAQWKQWRAQSLPREPSSDVRDTVRLSIRLASGERVVRRFETDADLEELYAFVECYDELQAGSHDDGVSEPHAYQHSYAFRLVSPMPRSVFDLETGGTIGERIGKSANLIVEPIEEDDEPI